MSAASAKQKQNRRGTSSSRQKMIKTEVYVKQYDVIPRGTQFYELDVIVDDEKIEKELGEICTDFSEGNSDDKEFIYNRGILVKVTQELERDFPNKKAKKIITLKMPSTAKTPKDLTKLLSKKGFTKK